MTSSNPKNPFAVWHGIDRSTINWQPTINRDKCTGCGLCVVTCGEKRNVFGFDFDEKKSVVMYPENCMIGCNNCTVACLWNAITHPDVSEARAASKRIPADRLKKELEDKLSANPALLV